MTDKPNSLPKTWKREIAIALIAFWAAISVKVFWYTGPDMVVALLGAYGTMTTATIGFAILALGLKGAENAFAVFNNMSQPRNESDYMGDDYAG